MGTGIKHTNVTNRNAMSRPQRYSVAGPAGIVGAILTLVMGLGRFQRIATTSRSRQFVAMTVDAKSNCAP